MTGYGKAEVILETGKITVEVRSLNGKTADIGLKTSMLPKDKEMAVRQKIAASLTRGNIDFFMNITHSPILKLIIPDMQSAAILHITTVHPNKSSNIRRKPIFTRKAILEERL